LFRYAGRRASRCDRLRLRGRSLELTEAQGRGTAFLRLSVRAGEWQNWFTTCEIMRAWCTYDCVRTETALYVPSSDGRVKSTTDANAIPPSFSRKFYGRHTRRMRAQYRRGRLCPDRAAVILHLPPLFAFRWHDRLERHLIGFRNRRRPQAD
jgi:hypothetical protein